MSEPEPTTLALVPAERGPSEPRTLALTAPRPASPARTGPAPAAPAPPTPDLSTLPDAAWRDDTGTPFTLTPARAGVHLGTGRDGRPVALPCPRPEGIGIAVLGESLFGRLIALRLLATGVVVTAVTREPGRWRSIRQAAGERLAFSEDPAAWPRHTPAPPAVHAGPQALVSDQRRAPSSAAAAGPWRTVLHVARDVPRGAAFWHRADVLLALGAEYAEAVGRLLGPQAAHLTSRLAPGEIVLFRPTGTEILRPDIAPGESAVLTPGAPPGR